MNATQRKMNEIQELLYDIYSASPYVTVSNLHTEALWATWERLAAESGER